MTSLSALFASADSGDPAAIDALFAALYAELHRLAERQLAKSGPGVGLGTTSLLHEAYVDISRREGLAFPDRARFLGYAARVMRGLVIDAWRRKQADKRGGAFEITGFDGKEIARPERHDELTRLDEALDELAEIDADLARLVDWKYFCGFSVPEIAALRGTSERSVERDWAKAKLLLHGALEPAGPA